MAPRITVISLEMKIHALVNKQRQAYGLNLLKFDPNLAVISRSHSMDMQIHHFFSHTNPAGDGPSQRAKKNKFPCKKKIGDLIHEGIAENIFQTYLYNSISYNNGIPHYHWSTAEDIVRSIVKGWMQSPGHRKNILSGTYESEGVGVAISDGGKIFATQNFF